MQSVCEIIRFPSERVARPTMDVLYEVAPDVRHVSLVAEAFGLDEPDSSIRDEADRAMAERIARMELPTEKAERRAVLMVLLKPLIARATDLCRQASEAARRSDEAAEKLVTAEIAGGHWMKPLEDASDARAFESAHALVDAYVASQEAYGADRAIGLAIRGEAWTPVDPDKDFEILLLAAAR